MRAFKGDLLRTTRSVTFSTDTGVQAQGTLCLVTEVKWVGSSTDLVSLLYGEHECDIWLDEFSMELVSPSEERLMREGR
jgi:hypothetical protein